MQVIYIYIIKFLRSKRLGKWNSKILKYGNFTVDKARQMFIKFKRKNTKVPTICLDTLLAHAILNLRISYLHNASAHRLFNGCPHYRARETSNLVCQKWTTRYEPGLQKATNKYRPLRANPSEGGDAKLKGLGWQPATEEIFFCYPKFRQAPISY